MQGDHPKEISKPGKAVAAGVVLFWFGTMVYGILPLYIGTQAAHLALASDKLGYLGTAYLCGFVASTSSAVWWIPRTHLRKLSAAAGMTSLGLIGISGLIFDILYLYSALFVAGIGSGIIYAIACRIVGSSKDPDRNFGFATGGQVISVAIVMTIATAWAIPRAGMAGLTWLTACAMLIFLFCLPLVPESAAPANDAPTVRGERAGWPSYMSLLAMLLLFGGGTNIWLFAQQIGVSQGNSVSSIGYILAFALVANAAGCFAASWLGRRFSRTVLLLVIQGTLILFCALLAHDPLGLGYFAATICGWSFFYGFSVVIGMSLIATVDRSGRAITGAGAAQSLGAALGPAVGGNFVVGGSFAALALLSAAAIAFSLLLGIAALKIHTR